MKCCDCGQNVDEREFAAFICEQCADNRALTSGSANTSTNKQSTSASQIAAQIDETVSNFDCTNPEQYPRLMREWARQLRTL